MNSSTAASEKRRMPRSAFCCCLPSGHRRRLLVAGLLLAFVSSTFSVFPHQLSYFNQLSGGTAGGHQYLVHSNISWGQDLFALRDWMNAHPHARPIGHELPLMWDPSSAGIPLMKISDEDFIQAEIRWYAVDPTTLQTHGLLSPVHGHDSIDSDLVHTLRLAEPVARIGASVYLFRSSEPANDTETVH